MVERYTLVNKSSSVRRRCPTPVCANGLVTCAGIGSVKRDENFARRIFGYAERRCSFFLSAGWQPPQYGIRRILSEIAAIAAYCQSNRAVRDRLLIAAIVGRALIVEKSLVTPSNDASAEAAPKY